MKKDRINFTDQELDALQYAILVLNHEYFKPKARIIEQLLIRTGYSKELEEGRLGIKYESSR